MYVQVGFSLQRKGLTELAFRFHYSFRKVDLFSSANVGILGFCKRAVKKRIFGRFNNFLMHLYPQQKKTIYLKIFSKKITHKPETSHQHQKVTK